MKLIIFLLSCVVACIAFPTFGDEWASFKVTHKKSYASQNEEQRRIKVYLDNKRLIEEHNALYEKGLFSYKLKMNHFGDMLEDEVAPYLKGINRSLGLDTPTNMPPISNLSEPMFLELPWTVDWRERGFVTPVKDQKNCGSCWAFATTGAMEGQHFRKTGELISLSEQNLMDCSVDNLGCSGGNMEYSYKYVISAGGLDTENDYPYKGYVDICQFNENEVGASISSYFFLPTGDEYFLQKEVALQGPIAVSINVYPEERFKFYDSGVYSDPGCDPYSLDHGVIVVGYGTEDGKDYWLIKNSWSDSWGDNGYMKLARNKNNMCGIATSASYPIV